MTLSVGSQETYVVGEDIVQISVTAKDPLGGALTFEVLNRPERAQFQTFKNSALFTWDPIPSDVTNNTPLSLIFAVTSSRGVRTERVVNLTIRPGNGQPRFLNSASELYDPQSGQPLVLDVQVRDDDSLRVQLTMPPHLAPQGATFVQTGDKTGTFRWLPTPEQAAQRVHAATFLADDGQNAPVEQRLSIVIRQLDTSGGINSPGGQGTATSCAAESLIQHPPLGPQRAVGDYPVEARLSAEAAQKYTSMYVYWTLGDALNKRDERYEGREMLRAGDVWQASITNPGLPAGQSADVFYTICAFDDNAGADDPNAYVCIPTSTTYSFVAYAPDEGSCQDDAQPIDNPTTGAGRISRDAWTYHRLCQGRSDYHRIEVQGGESLDLFVLYSLQGERPRVELLDVSLAPLPIERVGCTGIDIASVQNPAGSAPKTVYVKITGHDLPYQITAYVEDGSAGTGGTGGTGGNNTSGGQCPDSLEPDDALAMANPVTQSPMTFASMGICSAQDRDLFVVELMRGDVLTANLRFSHSQGDLELTAFEPGQEALVTDTGDTGVAYSWSSTDNETLNFPARSSGYHFLSVFGANGATAAYQLDVSFECGDADSRAGNHSQGAAATLTGDAELSGMKLCPFKADWYRLSATSGGLILAEVAREAGGAINGVTLQLYNQSNALLATGQMNAGRVEIEYAPGATGPLFLKVLSSESIEYQLTTLQF